MDKGHYFMLIVEITMQITKIKGFYSIPEMILVIIYPNSKPEKETKLTKQSLKCPLHVNEVCTRFPVVIRKESRHSDSERWRAI